MEFSRVNDKYNTQYTNALFSHKHIFYEIYKECNYQFLKGCGSYLFDGKHYTYCELTLSGPKRWETNNFVSFLHINFKMRSGKG